MLELLAKAPAGSRILDVGAAAGYLDRELQARGHRVTAIEQDPVRAEQARPYCEELIIGDVEALDVRGHAAQFDYVVLGDVLEHLKDPPATLGRLLETLKPGGRIIASEEAAWMERVHDEAQVRAEAARAVAAAQD